MGFMGSCPIAGVVWQHIHYIVGLQRLGHDVYYIEDSARPPYNPLRREVNFDFQHPGRVLKNLAGAFGFEHRWSYCARYLENMPTLGMSRRKIRTLYRDADAILNVCGAQEINDDLATSDRLIYIETDPGLEQIKVAQKDSGTLGYLRQHAALFTFGENVGTRKFPVPCRGLKWLPTRQPIVTEFWRTNKKPPGTAVFTSVANWSTSGQKDIAWRGETYLWSKSREFLRFIEAPRKAGETFELASDVDDERTRARFARNNWRLREPFDVSADYRLYRSYVRQSKGEFTVAKDQYVRLNTAWFSDRSACYLAAGRPVITQETGFTEHYGNAGGLFGFRSLGEIKEAVKMINADYGFHSRAARTIAQEEFEAERVLKSLLERTGV
jgi:hypothetical protein